MALISLVRSLGLESFWCDGGAAPRAKLPLDPSSIDVGRAARELAATFRSPLAPQTALGAALDNAGLQSDTAQHRPPGMLILLRCSHRQGHGHSRTGSRESATTVAVRVVVVI